MIFLRSKKALRHRIGRLTFFNFINHFFNKSGITNISNYVAEEMHEAANLSATAIESIQLGSSDYVGRTLVSETEIKEESPLTNSVRLMQPLMRFLQVNKESFFRN